MMETEETTELSLFGEEDFKRKMRLEAEPYLRGCETHGYFEGCDGARISYWVYRASHTEGHAPPKDAAIVISHGFCEFAEKYREVAYVFLRQGYSVYIPEHRGHGFSARLAKDPEQVYVTDYEQYVQDLHFFVKKIVEPQEKTKFLFCHSMGGAIGIRYLQEYPLTFRAAVLSSPMIGANTGKYPKWLSKIASEFYCAIGKGEKYAAGQGGFRMQPSYETSSSISRERYFYIYDMRLKNKEYRTYGASYAWARAGLRAVAKLQKQKNIDKIRTPMLIFAAGMDDMVDNDAIRSFAARAATATLVEVGQSKHEIYNAGYEVRLDYYRKIFDFFRGVCRT